MSRSRRDPRRRFLPAVALAALALLLTPPARATLVRELDFLSLHRRAATLFHGRCVEKNEVTDGNPIPYTEYTFEVLRAVKGCRDDRGEEVERITFRHAGARRGGGRADGLERAPLRFGVPEYEVGDELVLFLTRESSHGFCAPVGLSQGAFRVARGPDRRRVVENRSGSRLFAKVDSASFRRLSAEEGTLLRSQARTLDLEGFLGLCAKVKE